MFSTNIYLEATVFQAFLLGTPVNRTTIFVP